MRPRAVTPVVFAAALLASAEALADEGVKHESSAASSATVVVKPDGSVTIKTRNVRYIPYTILNPMGEHPTVVPRLATVVTNVRSRSDAEGVDPASEVSVTIDDLSGTTPRRIAAFTDPGSDGQLVGEHYFVSTQFGCCGGVDRHVGHATETGRLLFHSTGDGVMGRVAWAEIPNARPAIVRWAAFDGTVSEDELAQGVLGTLSYGGGDGTLVRLQLHMKGASDAVEEKNLDLASGADLGWIDGKRKGPKPDLASGEAGAPADLWSAEGAKVEGREWVRARASSWQNDLCTSPNCRGPARPREGAVRVGLLLDRGPDAMIGCRL